MQPKARHPLWGGASGSAATSNAAPGSQAGRQANTLQQQGTALNPKPWQTARTAGGSQQAAAGLAASAEGGAQQSRALAGNGPAAAAAGGSGAEPPGHVHIEQLRKRQLICRITVALLDACYNAVLTRQELVQQCVPAAPFPMFPLEKLGEGFRSSFGCEPDLPLLGCMSMKQLLMTRGEFSEHVKVMEQPIRDSLGRPHTMVQPLSQYTNLDTIKIVRGTKLELLRELTNQLQQVQQAASRPMQQQQHVQQVQQQPLPGDPAAPAASGPGSSGPASGPGMLRRNSSAGSGQVQHATNGPGSEDTGTPRSAQRGMQQGGMPAGSGMMGHMQHMQQPMQQPGQQLMQQPMQQRMQQIHNLVMRQPMQQPMQYDMQHQGYGMLPMQGGVMGPLQVAPGITGMSSGFTGMQGAVEQQHMTVMQHQQQMMQQGQQQMMQQGQQQMPFQQHQHQQQQQHQQPPQQQPQIQQPKKKKKQPQDQQQQQQQCKPEMPAAAADTDPAPAPAVMGGEGQPDTTLPVMDHIPKAMNYLKTALAYRTAAKEPYYLDQVYSDFELKTSHRLDTKLLGYGSLAELVTHGTAMNISLQPENGRIRVTRPKPQQNLNPLGGYAGLHGKKRPPAEQQDGMHSPGQPLKRPLPYAAGLSAGSSAIPGLSAIKAPAIPGITTGGGSASDAAGSGGQQQQQEAAAAGEVPAAGGAETTTVEQLEQQGYDPCVIYVSRLPSDVTRDELLEFFSPIGGIVHARLSQNKSLHWHAFIQFSSMPEAQDAIRYKHNALLRGHSIWVSAAKRRQPRPQIKSEAMQQQQQHEQGLARDAADAAAGAGPAGPALAAAAAVAAAPAGPSSHSQQYQLPGLGSAPPDLAAAGAPLQLQHALVQQQQQQQHSQLAVLGVQPAQLGGPGEAVAPAAAAPGSMPLPGTLFSTAGVLDPSTQVVMIVSGPPGSAAVMQQQLPLGPQALPGVQVVQQVMQQPGLMPVQFPGQAVMQQQQQVQSLPLGSAPPGSVMPVCVGMGGAAVAPFAPGSTPHHRPMMRQPASQGPRPMQRLGQPRHQPPPPPRLGDTGVQYSPTFVAAAGAHDGASPFVLSGGAPALAASSGPVSAAGGSLPAVLDMGMLQAVVSLAAAAAAGPALAGQQQQQQQQMGTGVMGPVSTEDWRAAGATAGETSTLGANTAAALMAAQAEQSGLSPVKHSREGVAASPLIGGTAAQAGSGPSSVTGQAVQQQQQQEAAGVPHQLSEQQQLLGQVTGQQLGFHQQQGPSSHDQQQHVEGSQGQLKLPAWMQDHQQSQQQQQQQQQQRDQHPQPQTAQQPAQQQAGQLDQQQQQQDSQKQEQQQHQLQQAAQLQQWQEWQQQQQHGQQAWQGLQQQQQQQQQPQSELSQQAAVAAVQQVQPVQQYAAPYQPAAAPAADAQHFGAYGAPAAAAAAAPATYPALGAAALQADAQAPGTQHQQQQQQQQHYQQPHQEPGWQPPLPPGAPPPATGEAGHDANQPAAAVAAPAAVYQQQPAQQWPGQQDWAQHQQQQQQQPDPLYGYQPQPGQVPGGYMPPVAAPDQQQQQAAWYQQQAQQAHAQQQYYQQPPGQAGYAAAPGAAVYNPHAEYAAYQQAQYMQQYGQLPPQQQQPVHQPQAYGQPPYGVAAGAYAHDPNVPLDPQSLQQLASWGVPLK